MVSMDVMGVLAGIIIVTLVLYDDFFRKKRR